jgi:hypothetical protein
VPRTMMKRVRCKSGIEGWQCRLRKNYSSFGEFERYSDTYGLHRRLSFETAREAWKSNPLVQGSVIPSDFQRARE